MIPKSHSTVLQFDKLIQELSVCNPPLHLDIRKYLLEKKNRYLLLLGFLKKHGNEYIFPNRYCTHVQLVLMHELYQNEWIKTQ